MVNYYHAQISGGVNRGNASTLIGGSYLNISSLSPMLTDLPMVLKSAENILV